MGDMADRLMAAERAYPGMDPVLAYLQYIEDEQNAGHAIMRAKQGETNRMRDAYDDLQYPPNAPGVTVELQLEYRYTTSGGEGWAAVTRTVRMPGVPQIGATVNIADEAPLVVAWRIDTVEYQLRDDGHVNVYATLEGPDLGKWTEEHLPDTQTGRDHFYDCLEMFADHGWEQDIPAYWQDPGSKTEIRVTETGLDTREV